MAETVPASRKLQRGDAEELLRKADRVAVAKGRKLSEFSGADITSDAAVMAMLGTTGNLRAPTIVVVEPSAGEREGLAPRMKRASAGEREGLAPRKTRLLVGFNETLFTEVFG